MQAASRHCTTDDARCNTTVQNCMTDNMIGMHCGASCAARLLAIQHSVDSQLRVSHFGTNLLRVKGAPPLTVATRGHNSPELGVEPLIKRHL